MKKFNTKLNYIGLVGNVEERATNLEITKRMIEKARKEVNTYNIIIPEKFDKRENGPIKVKLSLLKNEVRTIAGIMKLDTPALQEAYERGILTTINYGKIRAGGLPALEQYSSTPNHIKQCYEVLAKSLEDKGNYIISREAYDANWKANVNRFKNRIATEKNIRDILTGENDTIAYNIGIKDASKLEALFDN